MTRVSVILLVAGSFISAGNLCAGTAVTGGYLVFGYVKLLGMEK